jgi:hypothetical protein
MRKAKKLFVGEHEGKRPVVRPRHGWKDNIKMDLKGVDWIHVAQNRLQWRAVVNPVMSIRVPQKAGNFQTG